MIIFYGTHVESTTLDDLLKTYNPKLREILISCCIYNRQAIVVNRFFKKFSIKTLDSIIIWSWGHSEEKNTILLFIVKTVRKGISRFYEKYPYISK